MRKKIGALPAIVALTFLAGCSGRPGSVPPNSNTMQTPQPTIDQAPIATPTPAPTRATSAPLGGTINVPQRSRGIGVTA